MKNCDDDDDDGFYQYLLANPAKKTNKQNPASLWRTGFGSPPTGRHRCFPLFSFSQRDGEISLEIKLK